MNDIEPPAPKIETKKRFSLVWLMPVLAVAVAAWVVWSSYSDQGPLITVTFPTASGISAGSTEVRIRDLRVGLVEDVGFSDRMANVEARIRIDKDLARYVDEGAEFWLVEPQVTARGVTGIGTLLSGVYIAANWDGEEGPPQDEFTALQTPPLVSFGEEGTRLILRTKAGGQLAAGAPILASGIEVGRIGQPVLATAGSTVTMEAFVSRPYDRRLTTNTRFWDASGLSVNVGAQGLALKVNSLAALIEGGVNLGTPVTGGDPVADGHVYEVFSTEEAARADAFEAGSAPDILVSAMLDGDVSGLGLGTSVRFRGVKVGEVENVVGVAPDGEGDGPVRLRVDMSIAPTRIGLPAATTPTTLREALDRRVANGLRVRVASEGLFGQTVVLELATLPDAPEAEIAADDGGRLLIPTVAPAVSDGKGGVDSLVARVSNLPIEALMTAATDALSGVSRLTGQAESVLAADGVERIPATLDETLAEVRSLVADIRGGGAIENLNKTLSSADTTLQSVSEAAQSLPALAARLNAAADGLQSVVAGYTPESRIYTELRAVLNEVSSTAEAYRSLARTIERNPNSIITGR
ncbi:MlaD family protein [Fulvimarina sp. 2208YS6-2-32]|uniref:MlaD family protein n=1 Tax=Fulvimarina uroteuthidis TaxID=3098149 RepID=A0ABU5I0T0_9HYPH|nr:MlaD family protein [Fulvimarina sp. 2208YS6-2-32]MDY8108821.1 MlaD family protein [Fulvimarina sp. 2208YS6-2-32]